jgi:hypothetical protein
MNHSNLIIMKTLIWIRTSYHHSCASSVFYEFLLAGLNVQTTRASDKCSLGRSLQQRFSTAIDFPALCVRDLHTGTIFKASLDGARAIA